MAQSLTDLKFGAPLSEYVNDTMKYDFGDGNEFTCR